MIENTPLKVEGEEKIIKLGSSHFYVNEYTYFIIKLIERGENNESIKSILLKEHGICEATQNIDLLRNKLLYKTDHKTNKYIFFNLRLFSFDKENRNYGLWLLSLLYNKVIMLLTLILSIVLTYLNRDIFSVNAYTLFRSFSSHYSFIVVYFIASCLILVIHEFGHAAALYHYGQKPKEICFGFYLYFPVLYTDVSDAWQLERKKRIVVDCGGFYFQLLILCVLFFLRKLSLVSDEIIKLLIIDNLFMVLYNLNPLFRFDGYWICSDLFNLPNLRTRSNEAIIHLVANIFHNHTIREKSTYSIGYLLYGVISTSFIFFICCLFWRIALSTIIQDIFCIIHDVHINIFYRILKYIILSCGVFFSTKTVVLYFVNIVKNVRIHRNKI